jgi:hypothetical protein
MTLLDAIVIISFVIVVSIIIWLNIAYSQVKGEHFEQVPISDRGGTGEDYVCYKKAPTGRKLKFSSMLASKSSGDSGTDEPASKNPPANKVCNQLSSSGGDSNIDERLEIEDPARYYRDMYAKMPANFDDGRFAGYNYFAPSGFGNVKSIGQIPLQKTVDYPLAVSD